MNRTLAARTERMLTAPVLPTILRLSAPGVLLVAFQTLVSVGDTWFVGRLGTPPLAGLALVFPMLMLLQMTSSGAMGGGVASAIARALGAGDAEATPPPIAPAEVICSSMSRGKTSARPASGGVPSRPTNHVSPTETVVWKATSRAPGAERRRIVGSTGAVSRRSVRADRERVIDPAGS